MLTIMKVLLAVGVDAQGQLVLKMLTKTGKVVVAVMQAGTMHRPLTKTQKTRRQQKCLMCCQEGVASCVNMQAYCAVR